MHHTFERTTLTRGIKAIELGKTYDSRPPADDLNPDSDDLVDWGGDATHSPTAQRTRPLKAMTCIGEFNGVASGAVTAENDGCMWRAVNEQNGTSTEWNLSWVDSGHGRLAAVPYPAAMRVDLRVHCKGTTTIPSPTTGTPSPALPLRP